MKDSGTPTPKEYLIFTDSGMSGEASNIVRFEADPDTQPLFEGNHVSKPVPILVEGTFYGASTSGKPVKVTFDRKFLEDLVKNTKRDVPMNFDHFRGGPNHVGWVRAKSGKPMFVDKLEDGRYALFAQLEVTSDVYGMINKGIYRDMSAEVDRARRRLVGLALTNYPAVDGVHQFSIPDEENSEEVVMGDKDAVKQEEAGAVSFAEYEALQGQIKAMQEKMAELERKVAEEAARAERAEKLLQFSEAVEALVDAGKIPPGAKHIVTELFIFAAKHAEEEVEVRFSMPEGEEVVEKASPVDMLTKLFEMLPSADMFSQNLSDAEDVAEPDFDKDFVEGIKRIAEKKLA